VAQYLTVGNGGSQATVNLNGGMLTVARIIPNLANGSQSGMIIFNGGVLRAGPGAVQNFMSGLTAAYVGAYGAIIDSGANVIDIAQTLQDTGGGTLTKLGSGVLSLSGTNTYFGVTTVSNGTLLVNGGVAGMTEVAAGRLGGIGHLAGAVTIEPGATLAPGANGIGTLYCDSDLNLNGNLAVDLNTSLSQSNDFVAVTGTLNHAGAGTLTVSNLGPTLVAGQSFTLFSQIVPNGNSYTIVSPAGVTFTNLLAQNGSIAVVSVVPTIPTTPTNITYTVSSTSLTISWPSNYLGWSLQAQTNALSKGISTNWVIVPGSSSATSMTLPIDHSNPTVFYRLVYPQP
jgi:autotransporter-associated beta strand protein